MRVIFLLSDISFYLQSRNKFSSLTNTTFRLKLYILLYKCTALQIYAAFITRLCLDILSKLRSCGNLLQQPPLHCNAELLGMLWSISTLSTGCSLKIVCFFSRSFNILQPLPRQHWAAIGCKENGEPLRVTVLADLR